MFKMIVHITQSMATEAAALAKYNLIRDKLKSHTDLHINGQVIKKYTGYSPENPNGHEVQP